jgi:hypothetical protein
METRVNSEYTTKIPVIRAALGTLTMRMTGHLPDRQLRGFATTIEIEPEIMTDHATTAANAITMAIRTNEQGTAQGRLIVLPGAVEIEATEIEETMIDRNGHPKEIGTRMTRAAVKTTTGVTRLSGPPCQKEMVLSKMLLGLLKHTLEMHIQEAFRLKPRSLNRMFQKNSPSTKQLKSSAENDVARNFWPSLAAQHQCSFKLYRVPRKPP